MKSGGVALSLSMLMRNNFLSAADSDTRRSAYHAVLRICKLMLTAVGHTQVSEDELFWNTALGLPAVMVMSGNFILAGKKLSEVQNTVFEGWTVCFIQGKSWGI